MRNLRAVSAAMLLSLLFCARGAAYSELHMQKNMYPKKEPDILADTITRTSQTGPLPVFLAIRHSNLFPVELVKAVITAEFEGGAPAITKTVEYGVRLNRLMWSDVQYADIPADYRGAAAVNVDFYVKFRDGKEKTIRNNNARHAERAPMRVLVGAPPLPRFDNWRYGDTHFHTLFSENAAEFAAPPAVSADMAERFGLDWIAFTDHSFDLDDKEGDSETNDPALPRWNRYKKEVAEAAAAHPRVTLIPGVELSCGNSKGQNVHMLIYNPHKFYVGNGDGYERETTTPDLPCADVTAGLARFEAAFAAHPITELTSVEMYVINRGNWGDDDARAKGLSGLEAWNGTPGPLPGGMDMWRRALLSGQRSYLVGGTDAHGDFSLELGGWPEHLVFGQIRTAVYVDGAPTLENIISALKEGRAVATSGPLAAVELTNTAVKTAAIGGDLSGGPFVATVRARSTSEFGPVSEIRVIVGDLDNKTETVTATYPGKYAADPINMEETVKLPANVKRGYVRVEASSKAGELTFLAFTNPIWFEW